MTPVGPLSFAVGLWSMSIYLLEHWFWKCHSLSCEIGMWSIWTDSFNVKSLTILSDQNNSDSDTFVWNNAPLRCDDMKIIVRLIQKHLFWKICTLWEVWKWIGLMSLSETSKRNRSCMLRMTRLAWHGMAWKKVEKLCALLKSIIALDKIIASWKKLCCPSTLHLIVNWGHRRERERESFRKKLCDEILSHCRSHFYSWRSDQLLRFAEITKTK